MAKSDNDLKEWIAEFCNVFDAQLRLIILHYDKNESLEHSDISMHVKEFWI
jgi:hypothetical protein